MRTFLVIVNSFFSVCIFSQNAVIKGRISDAINNEPIPYANIVVQDTERGVSSDVDGNFVISNLTPGLYTLQASFIGYKKKTIFEIQVNNAFPTFVEFKLEQEATTLEGFEVVASPFNKTEESPVSMRTIGVSEIQRNPGGNRDISKVIQSLPGVASTVSFRNDIIIRGGAPNENRFYLDGVEVPNINHFATQGSSGGPVGLINVNFIREVDFYSGAFPANRSNALSSVFEFKQKEGNADKLLTNIMVGSSDIGLTIDGPLTQKSTFIFSARRSYLQFLFAALKLPFLPTYNDFQFKQKIKLSPKDEMILIGLGAIDEFKLNKNVNKGVSDTNTLQRNNYILGNLPVNQQWNYTLGMVYKHFRENSFQTIVVSRNHLNNSAKKYFNNDESALQNLVLNYNSEEIENKLRFENTLRTNGYKINVGINYEFAQYFNSTYNKRALPSGLFVIEYHSALDIHKAGAFFQVSKGFLGERLIVSLGLRTDANTYSAEMLNGIEQLSPRLSFSYSITEKMAFNFNLGRYTQLPSYTLLGYRAPNGALVNKENKIKYIKVEHLVGGLEYNPGINSKITFEGFFKVYKDYPFLINENVSLANLGGNFGVIGDSPANSISKGQTYGAEVLVQQKLYKGFYGILAYTFVRSEFTNGLGIYKPSAWDFGNIVSVTGGKKFKKNWELGVKWRYTGGAPYTPFNIEQSSVKMVWDVSGRGIPDYSQLNSMRLKPAHGLDVRLDKRYFFNKWSLNVYLDVQNLYNYQAEQQPYLDVRRDVNGNPITKANNTDFYETYLVPDYTGTVLPSVGLMIEF
ncbi:MAG: TonB-dependent receptor [Flavobacteriales bacterium]|nr:TonB-dependent receptor [Flavobacteriales bacterium]